MFISVSRPQIRESYALHADGSWHMRRYPNYLNYLAATVILQIAIYGKNFCTSAKEAFFLLMRNVVR